MKQCNLESCTGKGIIAWERDFFTAITQSRLNILDYVVTHGETLRDYYCSEVCPVAKFNKKYPKLEQLRKQEVYPFEGGINEFS